jgi:hypothetical protein
MQQRASRSKAASAAALLFIATGSCGVVDLADAFAKDVQPIVGGSIEDNANFPWVVHVVGAEGCHGVLIQPRWVLTAAHCVYQRLSGVKIEYTRTNPTTGAVTSGTQTTPAETQYGHYVFTHPNYTSSQFSFDIALVKLQAPFPDDPLLQPAELPLRRPTGGAAAEIATMSGAPSGKVSVMRGSLGFGGCLSELDQVCLFSPTMTNVCGGDSGSGLITRGDGFNYVTGILATARIIHITDECGGFNNVAATDVIQYLDWIADTMGAPPLSANFTPKVQLYWSSLDFGLPSTWETITGDFNGDRRADYARIGSTGAWLYFGNPSGTMAQGFLDYGDLAFGQPSNWTTIVGNFEGTGNGSCPKCMDFARLGDTGMWIFYGNSNGTFRRTFQSYAGLNFQLPSPWQTVVGDFDADGSTDYARLGSTGAWVFYGNTNRTFTQTFYAYQQGYDFGETSPYSLAVSDFNGDGRWDYARLGGTGAYVYYGAAGRTFTPSFQTYPGLDFGLPSTWETITGDFNGDHRADYARIGGTGAWVYYGTTSGFTQTFYSYGGSDFVQPSKYKTIVGDFDGDKRTDYGRLGDTGAYFYFGSATLGSFSTLFQEYQRHFGLPSSFSSVSGDFNGDGRWDYARLGGVFNHTFIRN